MPSGLSTALPWLASPMALIAAVASSKVSVVAPFVPASGLKVTPAVLLVLTLSAVMSATGVTVMSRVAVAVAPATSRRV
ncbi:MAG: hypothetical protein AW10_04132 [Candidatus Accumulibacter appositus]|uniref:Uncharacterized protein n=1 Tax=Candidatus Accumulibacter appositus TaxID=1454003 RepID=A0A011NNX1_9PROT|nr:MAG: hypothetical protein AW10_04132 [Candidatus Accumulibacter appositus]